MEGEANFRQWDALFPDALGLIFRNLQLQEVLQVIPLVCKSWCRVVEGPYCWQRIDIVEYSKHCTSEQLDRMLRTLITRSSGSLYELKVSYVDTDQMFFFIAEHAGSLRTLILRDSSISDSVVEQVAAKFSSLFYLDLSRNQLSTKALEAIGRNCQSLVLFGWEKEDDYFIYDMDTRSHKDEALIIAHNMPKLRQLSIAQLDIETPIVVEILSGCPELEWLNIRGCWKVELDKKLLEEKYPKLKVLGLLDTTRERCSYSDQESDYDANDYEDYTRCDWDQGSEFNDWL